MKKLFLTILLLTFAVSVQAGMIVKIPAMFGETELYCKVKQVNIKNEKVQEASGTVVITEDDPFTVNVDETVTAPNMVDTNRNPMAVVLSVYLQKGMQQIKILEFHKEYDPEAEETNPVIQAYDAVKADPEGKFVFVRDDI